MIASFALLIAAPDLAGAHSPPSTRADAPSQHDDHEAKSKNKKKKNKKNKKKKDKDSPHVLATYTECSGRTPLPTTIDLSTSTLYVVDTKGRPISPNLLNGTLEYGFDYTPILELLIDPAPGAQPVDAVALFFIDGELVSEQPLDPQPDGTGVMLSVKLKPSVHVEILFAAPSRPQPKLVLKPTDKCPPEPPPT